MKVTLQYHTFLRKCVVRGHKHTCLEISLNSDSDRLYFTLLADRKRVQGLINRQLSNLFPDLLCG